MSQQPPPLPIQDEQHSLFTEPPPLPFMQPPALPAHEIAASAISVPPKDGRLNPNVTFLLGIWVGIGLCAVAFCFLAISDRFEPFVRWIQRTAEELESPDSSDQTASTTTDENTDDAPSASTPEPTPPKAEKPKPNSAEFREGYEVGQRFGRQTGGIVYSQGRQVSEDELRGVVDGVRQFDNPYPEGSRKADDWLIGWEEGARAGLGKNLAKE